MQTANAYNPVTVRNIAGEMANHALERGEGLTWREYKRLGYTDEQIERNADEAARIFATSSTRRVA